MSEAKQEGDADNQQKAEQESVNESPESVNESQETRRFDAEQIRGGLPRPGLVLRQRYRLDSEIGRGAMGIVFRATDLELLRPVAVKVLAERLTRRQQEATTEGGRQKAEGRDKGEPSREPQAGGQNAGGRNAGETPAVPGEGGSPAFPGAGDDGRLRFLREARAAAALNHPHIVAIYDVGEDHGFPFFVMELVDGPNLGQTPPHDLQQVVEFACQICAALEHAHANNIVHRDLKPANVLLSGLSARSANTWPSDPESQISNLKSEISDLKSSDLKGSDLKGVTVKLADLGLALPARGSRISHAGTIVGTAAYMAPEQALGKTVDGRADLYALGVVLYELTTGRVPFLGDDPLATISQHLHAPVVPPRVLRSGPAAPDRDRHSSTTRKRPGATFSRPLPKRRLRSRGAARNSAMSWTEDGGSTVALLDALSRGRLVARGRRTG